MDRFPTAERREVVDAERVFDVFDPVSFTHLYLLGYDARKDLEVLARAIDRFPNTIGLIASASKREHLFATLRERGIPREALERVRSPVVSPSAPNPRGDRGQHRRRDREGDAPLDLR